MTNETIKYRLIKHLQLKLISQEIMELIDQAIDLCQINIDPYDISCHYTLHQMGELYHNEQVYHIKDADFILRLKSFHRIQIGIFSLGEKSQQLIDNLSIYDVFFQYLIHSILDIILMELLENHFQNQLKFKEANEYQMYVPLNLLDNLLYQTDIFNLLSPKMVLLDDHTFQMKPIKSVSFVLGWTYNQPEKLNSSLCDVCQFFKCHNKVPLIPVSIDQQIYQVPVGTRLLDVFIKHQIPIEHYCNGKQTCKKCWVMLIEAGQSQLKLACEIQCLKPLEVKTMISSQSMKIETSFENEVSLEEDASNDDIGIVFDVGTTTIVASLYTLNEKKRINAIAQPNAQRIYGFDVIQRIEYATTEINGLSHLRLTLVRQLNDMIDEILNYQNHQQIHRCIIVGNPTMIGILQNKSIQSLGVYPFINPVPNSVEMEATEIDIHLTCKIECIFSISGFIGSDVVAGMVATDIHKDASYRMLIDLGTNGEIALGNQDGILACSTAAGPAFEGASITCGVPSIAGAISRFSYQKPHQITTIFDLPPIGFCGSGIIDLISELIKHHLVDEQGTIKEGSSIRIDIKGHPFTITQKDIREIQLAKSAIRTGIELLLSHQKITYKDVKSIAISGGLGSQVDVNHAINIGLIPRAWRDKVQAVGNSALHGARLYLLDETAKNKFAQIESLTKTLDLTLDSQFNDLFVENLILKES